MDCGKKRKERKIEGITYHNYEWNGKEMGWIVNPYLILFRSNN